MVPKPVLTSCTGALYCTVPTLYMGLVQAVQSKAANSVLVQGRYKPVQYTVQHVSRQSEYEPGYPPFIPGTGSSPILSGDCNCKPEIIYEKAG